MLHLPPLIFHCGDGCWEGTISQDFILLFSMGSEATYSFLSSDPFDARKGLRTCVSMFNDDGVQTMHFLCYCLNKRNGENELD